MNSDDLSWYMGRDISMNLSDSLLLSLLLVQRLPQVLLQVEANHNHLLDLEAP